jgi:hypothetical protein
MSVRLTIRDDLMADRGMLNVSRSGLAVSGPSGSWVRCFQRYESET